MSALAIQSLTEGVKFESSNGHSSFIEASLSRMEGCLDEIRNKSAELAALRSVPQQLTSMQEMLRYLTTASEQLSAEVLALDAHAASPPHSPRHNRRASLVAAVRPAPSPTALKAKRRSPRKAPLDPKKFQSAPANAEETENLNSCLGDEAPSSPGAPKVRSQRSWGDKSSPSVFQPSQITVQEPPSLCCEGSDGKDSQQIDGSSGVGRNHLTVDLKNGKTRPVSPGKSKGLSLSTGDEEDNSLMMENYIPRRRRSWCLNERSMLSRAQTFTSSDRSCANYISPVKEMRDASSKTVLGHTDLNLAHLSVPTSRTQKTDRRYTSEQAEQATLSITSADSGQSVSVISQESAMSLGVINKYSSALFQKSSSLKQDVNRTGWVPPVLRPNSHSRLAWDVLIILNSVCIGIIIPLGMVYFDSSCSRDVICLSDGMNAALLYIVDVLWPLDIILNFRTGFFSQGEVEMNSWLIVLHYMRNWLVFDLLAAFPLALTSTVPTLHIVACSLKLLRLLQIIPRIARLQAEYRTIGLLQAKISIVYILLAHMTACGWRLVQDDQRLKGSVAPWWDLYLADLYWVIMTFTTVGYGDIVPNSTRAQMYAIVVMCIGCASFGGVVSACTQLTSKVFNDEIESQVADVMRFMARRSVPKDLQRRVQRNLRHHLHSQQLTSIDPELLAMLSPAMQKELSLSLLGSTVLRFPLFQNTQRSFLAELAQVHCWVQCVAGDIVLEEGEILQNLIFVIRGRLVSRSSPGADTQRLDVSISEALKLSLDNNEEVGDALETSSRVDALWTSERAPNDRSIMAGA